MSEQKKMNEVSLSIENLTGNSLVNVTEWEKKIKEVKENNPIIPIVDNGTYELQKKNRTAVKSVRVEIDKQDKVIASAFTKIRKETTVIRDSLLAEIEPFEEEHEAEVSRWENIKKKEKEEKEAAEQKRIDAIKDKVDEIESKANGIIQTMTFETIGENLNEVTALFDTDYDFEEFDILLSQASFRVMKSHTDKQSDLIEKENQRLENERLAKENEESKKRESLQNERLEKLYPVMAFVKDVKLPELHTYSEDLFSNILIEANEAKAESDRLAHEEFDRQEKERKDREEKERAEKEKVFEVKSKRLFDLGFSIDYPEYGNFSHPDVEGIVTKESVLKSDTLEFEDIIDRCKYLIAESEETKLLKERFESRSKELFKIGFGQQDNNFYNHKYNFGFSVSDVETFSDQEFTLLQSQILDNFKAKDDEKAKAHKENTKRQKQIAGDKKMLSEYIESLDFRADVPDPTHGEMIKLLESYEHTLKVFKENLIEELKNF